MAVRRDPEYAAIELRLAQTEAALEAMRASEARYHSLFQNALDALLVADDEGRYVDANAAACELLGYRRDELLELGVFDVTPAPSREAGRRMWRQFIAAGEMHGQYELERRDGETRAVEFRAVANIRPGLHLSALRDVTARVQAEREAARFRAMADQAVHGSAIADLDGNLIYVNQYMAHAHGYASGELLGQNLAVFHSAEQWPEVERLNQRLIAEGSFDPTTVWHTHRDGTAFPMLMSATMVRDARGEPEFLVATALDITAQVRDQQALRASEARFSTVFRHAPLPMAISAIDDGRYLEVNDAFVASLGYPREAVIGHTPADLEFITAEQRQEMGRRLRDQGRLPPTEFEVQRADGEPRTLMLSGEVVRVDDELLFLSVAEDITERRHTERALRESEARFRALVEAAPVSILLLRDGKYTFGNPASARLLGYDTPDQIVGLGAMDTIAPESRAVIRERMARVAGGLPNPAMELLLQRPDGSRLWSISTSVPVVIDGQPTTIIVGQDITPLKEAQQALHASQRRFATIFRRAPLLMTISAIGESADERGMLEVNDAFVRVTGYTRREALGRTAAEIGLIAPHRAAQLWAEVDAHGYVQDVELELTRADGTPLDLLYSAEMVPIEGKKRLIEIAIDISARKTVEEALRENERQKSIILDAISEMVAYYDADMRVIWANRAAGQSVGRSEGDLVGAYCYDIWESGGEPCEGCPVVRARETRQPQQLRRQTPDGRHWFLRGYPILDERGEVVNLVEFGQDITESVRAIEERENLQKQLEQAQKMEAVGRLAGGVAHDFNNMLAVILGRAELALETVDERDPVHDELVEIARAGRRSADLTRQLLAFARRQTVTPRVLDLNETLAGMYKMLLRLIGEDIDLVWKPGADLWTVRIDPSQIDSILANLCVNARDAIAGVGQVVVETHNIAIDETYCAEHADCEPGDYVQLVVSDDGCGMDAETMSHLFEPFFTTKAPGKGTGLGLATLYGIVRQNAGFVNVYSEPGQGSTFRIYLPRYRAKTEQRASVSAEPKVVRGQETVLLVEDEPAILSLGRTMLERLGYRVLPAATPGEAIETAHQYQGAIDLLMTDVIMPEMNGRDLAARLLTIYPHIKRLFMSGYTADVIAHHGVLDPGVAFLPKPYTLDGLARKVREALEDDR